MSLTNLPIFKGYNSVTSFYTNVSIFSFFIFKISIYLGGSEQNLGRRWQTYGKKFPGYRIWGQVSTDGKQDLYFSPSLWWKGGCHLPWLLYGSNGRAGIYFSRVWCHLSSWIGIGTRWGLQPVVTTNSNWWTYPGNSILV